MRGFGAAAGFILTLTVTNTSSTHDAGLFLFCIAIATVGATFCLIGSPQALVRIVGANADDNWPVINLQFSVVLKLVVGFCLVAALIFYLFNVQIAGFAFNNPLLTQLLPLTGVAILLFAVVQLFASVLQGRESAVYASVVQNVLMPTSFMLGIAVHFFFTKELVAKELMWFYLISLALAAVAGIVGWAKDSRSDIRYQPGFPLELRQSLYPLFIVSCMILCVQWAGQFATARYLAPEQVALFASAQRTALLASFVLIAVNLVVAPKFANAFAKANRKEVNSLSLLSSRLMLAMAAPVLLFMIIFPKFLMGLFGDEYVFAAPLLQIMAVGQFINAITGSVGYLLVMTNHEKDYRNVVLFSGPLAIVLAFVLTNEYGLIGAAYATAISVATLNLLAVWMVKKRLGFNTLNIFRKV